MRSRASCCCSYVPAQCAGDARASARHHRTPCRTHTHTPAPPSLDSTECRVRPHHPQRRPGSAAATRAGSRLQEEQAQHGAVRPVSASRAAALAARQQYARRTPCWCSSSSSSTPLTALGDVATLEGGGQHKRPRGLRGHAAAAWRATASGAVVRQHRDGRAASPSLRDPGAWATSSRWWHMSGARPGATPAEWWPPLLLAEVVVARQMRVGYESCWESY
jgi:hypothetical protein